ncbi:hypothetical protein IMX07_02465 [bacterium]|nr:hypothetical protein [bacterium]
MNPYSLNAQITPISDDLAEERRKLKGEGLRLAAHHRRMLRKHFPPWPASRRRRGGVAGARWLPGFVWNGFGMEYSESRGVEAQSAKPSAPFARGRRRAPIPSPTNTNQPENSK